MGLNQRNRIVIRCVVAVLWLLGFVAAPSTGTMQRLYWLPALALLSFLLVDYFSGFIIAILLTVVVKTLDLDQVPGITQALIIDAVWIAAIVAAGIKLLKPFNTAFVKNRAFAPTIPSHPLQESPLTSNFETGELPVNFRHDLQTPIKLILGFCNAILRTERNQGQGLPPQYHDNVQAIYRNAQQLENMLGDFLNQLPSAHARAEEALEPVALIQETVAMIQDLMAAHRIKLEVKIDDPIPKLTLHRVTIRQILLNVLRTIARLNNLPEVETLVTVRINVQHPALHITVTAPSANVQSVVADASWKLNFRLVETVGGKLWVEANGDPTSDAYSNIVLALPLPVARTDHRNILVVSEDENIIDFFKEHLRQYRVLGIKDMQQLIQSVAQVQPVGIILTSEQHALHQQKFSDLLGDHTPIIVCAIATAQEMLQRLDIVYLPKPVNYDTLFGILMKIKRTVAHILIVDDNIDSAEMLALMLASMSPAFITRKAYLAQDALTLLDEYEISAIILDVSLPDMDGITLSQRIRSREHYAHLPIVLVSAQESLDALMPIIVADKISLFQVGGFESGELASYIESLINATMPSAPI